MAMQRKAVNPPVSLHQRWRVALSEAGTSESKWASARGLTPGHVHQVVLGRQSEPLLALINEFIEEQERALLERLTAAYETAA